MAEQGLLETIARGILPDGVFAGLDRSRFLSDAEKIKQQMFEQRQPFGTDLPRGGEDLAMVPGLEEIKPGLLRESPQTDLIKGLLESKTPGTVRSGLLAGYNALAQQNQQARAAAAQAQRAEAIDRAGGLLSTREQFSPGEAIAPPRKEIQSLLEMAKIPGFEKQAMTGLLSQLDPVTLSGGQARISGTGEEIARLDKMKDPSKDFANSKGMRGEFTQVTKNIASINDAYGRILASGVDPTGAGDLSLIFNYMKMLDPESTVRESEFAQVALSGSLGQRIKGGVQKILTGKRLDAPLRNDFLRRTGKLYKEADKIYGKRRGEFERLAEQQNLDPTNVVFERSLYTGDEIDDVIKQRKTPLVPKESATTQAEKARIDSEINALEQELGFSK